MAARDLRDSRATQGRVSGACARGASSSRASPRPACGSRSRVPDGEVALDVDLVFVAIGFTGVESDDPLYGQLGLELGRAPPCRSTRSSRRRSPGVFAAGDCVRGADLIVQAIADGREAARSVDLALQGASALPSRVAVW